MEPAGVALGGLALVSLFSSCVEFLDLLEQGKNYSRDVRIAATKLRLLRQRLQAWGKTHTTYDSDSDVEGCSDLETTTTTTRRADDGLVIESLLGIKGLLWDASRLCAKYTLPVESVDPLAGSQSGRRGWFLGADGPSMKQGSHTPGEGVLGVFARGRAPFDGKPGVKGGGFDTATYHHRYLSPHDGTDALHALPTAVFKPQSSLLSTAIIPRSVQLFRFKFSWAVFDRRQFETLIADLDFLVTNLENISRSSSSSPPPPHTHRGLLQLRIRPPDADWASTCTARSSASNFTSASAMPRSSTVATKMPQKSNTGKSRNSKATPMLPKGSSSDRAMVPYKPDPVQSGASSDAEDAAQPSLASDQPQAPGVTRVTNDNNVAEDHSYIYAFKEQQEGVVSSGDVISTNNKVTKHSEHVVGVMSLEALRLISSRRT